MATKTHWNCPARRGRAVCEIDYTSDNWTHCVHCQDNVLERKDEMVAVHVMNNIFDGTPSKCIMVQQVNCQGKMNSGLAKAIRQRYPEVYEQYRTEYEMGMLELGYVIYVEVEEDLFVANICGQDRYGYDGKQYTNVDALRQGLEDVRSMAESLNFSVAIPSKIGCVRGGADVRVVHKMIDEIFSNDLVGNVYQGGFDEDGEYREEESKSNSHPPTGFVF